ncbi:MAG: DegT/DnrJ/EryC1/StrS family aminotransferase, partial [Candidatus Omnitrophica bacterium]|nr:DegT/DnrJ/EryC1/StrS family aminotransferase [Candidatus Omnitrophota bacterium]
KREKIWTRYNAAFKEMPVETPAPVSEDTVHARHLYTILVSKTLSGVSRDEMQQCLYERKIGTGIHFTALHLSPYYQHNFGYKKGDFPSAEYISERTLSLPLSAKLTDTDVEDVIEAVRMVLRQKNTMRP